MLIDSHAHLTASSVEQDLERILKNAKQSGVEIIVNISTDPEELKKGILLAERFPWIFNAAATTPHDVEKQGESDFAAISNSARNHALIAIGETGLDYHYTHSPAEVQKTFLRRYLHLALECALPVVIHCREAFSDFFQILDAEYQVNGKHAPGVLHCFTGNLEEAEAVIERGWHLSLSGIVTFKKSYELQEVAKIVPLEQLLIETDTPYLAPHPFRGKPNEPAYLVETAKCIAELRKISYEELAKATSANARSLFKI